MNEKKFFLTPNEFSVISAGFGLSMVYGLKQIDGRLDTKEICMALHNMYVNNVIENMDSKQFITDPDITTMIGTSECIFCIYPANPCVIIEENQANKDKVILYMDYMEDILETIAKETVNKPMQICCMATENGRVISEEQIDKTVDRSERFAILKRNYMSIM